MKISKYLLISTLIFNTSCASDTFIGLLFRKPICFENQSNTISTKSLDTEELPKTGDTKMNQLNELISADPTNHSLYYQRGEYFTEIREYEKAMSDLNKAIELFQQYPAALMLRGWLFKREQKLNEAFRDFRKAVEASNTAISQNPHDAANYYYRAYSYQMLFKDEEAVNDYNKACELGYKSACLTECKRK